MHSGDDRSTRKRQSGGTAIQTYSHSESNATDGSPFIPLLSLVEMCDFAQVGRFAHRARIGFTKTFGTSEVPWSVGLLRSIWTFGGAQIPNFTRPPLISSTVT